jgi:hypothetical protein
MNILDRQITEEGPRNAVVKLTGTLDTSDIYETPAISVGDFSNNEKAVTLTGFRVDMMEYSIGQGLEILLEWNSAIPKQIFSIAGRGKIFSYSYGGFIPDATRTGYDGSINLKTTGFAQQSVSPQNFTVVLELVKLYRV